MFKETTLLAVRRTEALARRREREEKAAREK